jgi:hypothetical protein
MLHSSEGERLAHNQEVCGSKPHEAILVALTDTLSWIPSHR